MRQRGTMVLILKRGLASSCLFSPDTSFPDTQAFARTVPSAHNILPFSSAW